MSAKGSTGIRRPHSLDDLTAQRVLPASLSTPLSRRK